MAEYIMTGFQLAARAKRIAGEPSLYVMGAFGAPSSSVSRSRYTGPNANEYNRRPERTRMILQSANGTWFFDCVGLIKGILWGFDFNLGATYGGAIYQAHGVPDVSADTMITKCSGVSTNFANLPVGAMLYSPGHCGIYIGNGQAVECTPAWDNRVQITNLHNMGNNAYPCRTWMKWGRLPWVDYSEIPFVDVPQGSYYRQAVEWAYDNGITAGTDHTHFSPDMPCSRAQIVTMLHKLWQLLKGD